MRTRYRNVHGPLEGLPASDAESDAEEQPENSCPPAKKQRQDVIDIQALQEHGFRSGPSVLFVPDKVTEDSNWEW